MCVYESETKCRFNFETIHFSGLDIITNFLKQKPHSNHFHLKFADKKFIPSWAVAIQLIENANKDGLKVVGSIEIRATKFLAPNKF